MGREPLSQHEPSPKEPRLHCWDAQSQLPGDIIPGKLLDIPKHHDNTVLGGKLQEAPFNELSDFSLRMALLGVVLPSLYLTRAKVPIFLIFTSIQAVNVFPASQTLKRGIPRDTDQPSRELRATLESTDMLKSAQERILHGILRVKSVAQDRHQSAINQLGMPTN
jgi:hypothetical protein